MLAHLVTERRRELGIRLALGARPRDVVGLIVGEGVRLTAAGVALGLLRAVSLSRVIASQLLSFRLLEVGRLGDSRL